MSSIWNNILDQRALISLDARASLRTKIEYLKTFNGEYSRYVRIKDVIYAINWQPSYMRTATCMFPWAQYNAGQGVQRLCFSDSS